MRLLLLVSEAHAGMPFVTLSDGASLRLEAISFFGVSLLVVAAGLRLLWNRLTPLPRLSYGRALGLTVLWGLCFHLILTMISGARELMTPGAWEKRGAIYGLKSETSLSALLERQRELVALREALWAYAEVHDGALPPHGFDPTIPEAAWLIEPYGLRVEYQPGLTMGGGHVPLAWEPEALGKPQLALYADGEIDTLELR